MKLLELANEFTSRGDLFIRQNGVNDFHLFASDLLNHNDLSRYFNIEELIQIYFLNHLDDIQNFKHLEFSDLPLTISRGENCFVDLYFWRRRATVIHNHHFRGAFACLYGKNVDYRYSFSLNEKLTPFHETGILKMEEKRVILPGRAVEIDFLDKFIHQNHHHADLTVNLCFRTPDIVGHNLSNFLFSGFKYVKNAEHLSRVFRLRRFLDFHEVNFEKLEMGLDDCLSFLTLYHTTQTGNLNLKNVLMLMEKRIKNEIGLNLPEMLDFHDKKMDEIENDYE